MKRQYLLLIFICLFFFRCSNLKKSDNRSYKMETFDLKYFVANQKNGTVDTILNDGTQIVLRALDSDYVKEVRISKSSPFHTFYFFYRHSLKLKAKGTYFFDCPRSSVKFDKNGRITENINYDSQFKFTIEDLIRKMRDEFGVDLTNREQKLHVQRSVAIKIKHPNYILMIYLNEDTFRYLMIDGKTGEIKKNFTGENVY